MKPLQKDNPFATFIDALHPEYQPPKPPPDFPKEIGINLYNLDVCNEKAVKQFIWRYMDENSYEKEAYDANLDLFQRGERARPSREEYIEISRFQDVLGLKPMIKRAIKGEQPKRDDLVALKEHLLERSRYTHSNTDNPSNGYFFYETLPEGKEERIIIKEISDNNDGRLRWKIYKWIFYVWALGIEVKECVIQGCGNIFVASNEKRGRPRNRCCSKSCQKIYKNEYNKLYVKYIDRPRWKGQPTKSTEWVEQEALKRLGGAGSKC